MAFCENDFLLVCSDRENERFGDVHHINNHFGKEEYCCTIDELLYYLVSFVDEGEIMRKNRSAGKSYKNVSRRNNLSKPLKMLRRAVLNAKMKQVSNIIE